MAKSTGDPQVDAWNIAGAIATRYCRGHGISDPRLTEIVEGFQIFALDLFAKKWDPSQSAVSTYVYGAWPLFARRRAEMEAHGNFLASEVPCSPHDAKDGEKGSPLVMRSLEDAEPVHDLSERAMDLIAALPPKLHSVVLEHIAFGISVTATAELLGISDRTVTRHTTEAKRWWRDNLTQLEGDAA